LRKLLIYLVVFFIGAAAAQVQVQVGDPFGPSPAFGPVSIRITDPEPSLGGLGPKMDMDEEFDLAFDLVVSNLTVKDLKLQILSFDEINETYVPFEGEYIIVSENVSFSSLKGPTTTSGRFRLKIPERGYYLLKIRGNYTVDGRNGMTEAGDIVWGPRIRVIPDLGDSSWSVIIGMPVLPLVAGVMIRTVRRRETKKRRRGGPSPSWLEKIKESESE
jgi:hypothetical protein